MSGKSITLDLPEDLYERVRQVAEQSQRSLEHVLVESIRLLLVSHLHLPMSQASLLPCPVMLTPSYGQWSISVWYGHSKQFHIVPIEALKLLLNCTSNCLDNRR